MSSARVACTKCGVRFEVKTEYFQSVHSRTICPSTQPLSLAIVELLADVLDEDVLSMKPPLGDVIDPNVLASLGRSGNRPEQTFIFTYRGLGVSVTNQGRIRVVEPPKRKSS